MINDLLFMNINPLHFRNIAFVWRPGFPLKLFRKLLVLQNSAWAHFNRLHLLAKQSRLSSIVTAAIPASSKK